MILSIILLLAGLALVVAGSNFLVDGASSVARKVGVSEFVIGLTIVGFGTSTPELVVSITGALSGSSAIALGNVVGSNIFNVLLILGLTALISPVAVTRANKTVDIPIMLGATLLFCLIVLTGKLNRIDAAMMLLVFAAYIWYNFKTGKVEAEPESSEKTYGTFISILMVAGGLAGLIFGGKLFVNNAVDIAHRIGASEKFIAITILAVGTSLPELMTSIVAIAKKKSQLALGNIVGSNVFNILLILGVSGMIYPLQTSSMNYVDLGVVMFSAVLLFVCAFASRKSQLSKVSGTLMLLTEAAYMTYLFINL